MLGWIQGVNKQEQIPSCFLISSWWLSVLRNSPGWGLSDPWLIRQEDQGWPALGCRLLHCRNFMPCSACPQSLLKLPSMNSWFLPGQASRNAAEWPCSLCITPWAKGTLGSCAGWAYWAVRWCPRRVSKLCVLFSHCQESWAFFFFLYPVLARGQLISAAPSCRSQGMPLLCQNTLLLGKGYLIILCPEGKTQHIE